MIHGLVISKHVAFPTFLSFITVPSFVGFCASKKLFHQIHHLPHTTQRHHPMPESSTTDAVEKKRDRYVAPGKYYHLNNFTASSCLVDVGAAVAVGLVAAIPVSVIDYSIISKVRGFSESSFVELKKGLTTFLLRPHKFFFKTPENHYAVVYRAVAVVYAFTYIFANLTRSYCDANNWNPDYIGYAVAVTSSIANIGLTVWKDGVILKVFPQKQLPVPIPTKIAFAIRDFITCLAAFQYAPMLAARLSARYKPEELPLSAGDCGQVIVPASLQVFTTVIHIVAIRYQATNGKLTLQDASLALKKDYINSVFLRICRIVPAFGIGGIGNRNMRNNGLLSIPDEPKVKA